MQCIKAWVEQTRQANASALEVRCPVCREQCTALYHNCSSTGFDREAFDAPVATSNPRSSTIAPGDRAIRHFYLAPEALQQAVCGAVVREQSIRHPYIDPGGPKRVASLAPRSAPVEASIWAGGGTSAGAGARQRGVSRSASQRTRGDEGARSTPISAGDSTSAGRDNGARSHAFWPAGRAAAEGGVQQPASAKRARTEQHGACTHQHGTCAASITDRAASTKDRAASGSDRTPSGTGQELLPRRQQGRDSTGTAACTEQHLVVHKRGGSSAMTEWLRRELQALLLQDDTSHAVAVRAFSRLQQPLSHHGGQPLAERSVVAGRLPCVRML